MIQKLTYFFLLAVGTVAMAQDLTIVNAARTQVGKTVLYDPAYVTLAYPGGDLPLDRGVCTDVVIRALRQARQADLQKLVHEDMRGNFPAYPKIWGLKKPDANIDHRRVPNLQRFFTRQGMELKLASDPSKMAEVFLPGDLVTCIVPPNLPHIMVVSDQKSENGVPLVLHNIGRGAQEEDVLFRFKLTGHYRWPKVQNSANKPDSDEKAKTDEKQRKMGMEQKKGKAEKSSAEAKSGA
jgi:hypothetical protein